VTIVSLIGHIQEDLVPFHEKILPILVEVMGHPASRVQEKSCVALEAYIEHLGSSILPYLHPLMEKLVFMLQNGNLKTQETVVCAIGSAAHSAGKVSFFFLSSSLFYFSFFFLFFLRPLGFCSSSILYLGL